MGEYGSAIGRPRDRRYVVCTGSPLLLVTTKAMKKLLTKIKPTSSGLLKAIASLVGLSLSAFLVVQIVLNIQEQSSRDEMESFSRKQVCHELGENYREKLPQHETFQYSEEEVFYSETKNSCFYYMVFDFSQPETGIAFTNYVLTDLLSGIVIRGKSIDEESMEYFYDFEYFYRWGFELDLLNDNWT